MSLASVDSDISVDRDEDEDEEEDDDDDEDEEEDEYMVIPLRVDTHARLLAVGEC